MARRIHAGRSYVLRSKAGRRESPAPHRETGGVSGRRQATRSAYRHKARRSWRWTIGASSALAHRRWAPAPLAKHGHSFHRRGIPYYPEEQRVPRMMGHSSQAISYFPIANVGQSKQGFTRAGKNEVKRASWGHLGNFFSHRHDFALAEVMGIPRQWSLTASHSPFSCRSY